MLDKEFSTMNFRMTGFAANNTAFDTAFSDFKQAIRTLSFISFSH